MTTNARDEKWGSWIEHDGKSLPIDDRTEFQYRLRCGTENKAYNKASDYRNRFIHKGDNSDIIAYRYKIKEPESDINEDLYWLAKSVTEWPDDYLSVRRDKDFTLGYCFTKRDDVKQANGWYTREQYHDARQQLGLDQPAVTPEEEEAWQAKERKLIGGPRKAESFLMQAADLMAERGEQYDQDGGERSMGKTVSAFNTITGRDLTESEGWLLMSILKRVRQHSGAGYHKDSAEDAVAYAALEAEALECAATQQS